MFLMPVDEAIVVDMEDHWCRTLTVSFVILAHTLCFVGH
jgi:hypothetical protein